MSKPNFWLNSLFFLRHIVFLKYFFIMMLAQTMKLKISIYYHNTSKTLELTDEAARKKPLHTRQLLFLRVAPNINHQPRMAGHRRNLMSALSNNSVQLSFTTSRRICSSALCRTCSSSSRSLRPVSIALSHILLWHTPQLSSINQPV